MHAKIGFHFVIANSKRKACKCDNNWWERANLVNLYSFVMLIFYYGGTVTNLEFVLSFRKGKCSTYVGMEVEYYSWAFFVFTALVFDQCHSNMCDCVWTVVTSHFILD